MPRNTAIYLKKSVMRCGTRSGACSEITTFCLQSIRGEEVKGCPLKVFRGNSPFLPCEEAALDEPSEQTALLGGNPDLPYGGLDSPKTLNRKWDEAITAGKINTTWQREAKVLTKSSAPLILTFLLQYSLPVASIFTVGHIGKVELGAVSLASSKWLHTWLI
jgi:hypothetical protein